MLRRASASMPLVCRRLDLAPDVLGLARSVADRSSAVVLFSADGSGPSFVACDPIAESDALDPEPELTPDPSLDKLGDLPRWVGLLPYEARRSALERRGRAPDRDKRPEPELSRPVWWRYGAVARIDAGGVVIGGDDQERLGDLERLLCRKCPPAPIRILPSGEPEPDLVHTVRIRRALELIASGELYQVNLSRRIALRVEGHPFDVLAALAARARPPFGMALRSGALDVVSTSPELFLRFSADGLVETVPIKGTRPRGRSHVGDDALRQELDSDPKERAELAMVIDVERNDLGTIAETGSVELVGLPEVRTHASVHHRQATVRARLRRGVSRRELIEAMLPSGSVTGAPKRRAMEVIAELEAARRGLYTGALGYLAHSGALSLAMAIRTLVAQAGQGSWHVGGGIVADSDPAREVEETRWKTVQLFGAMARVDE